MRSLSRAIFAFPMCTLAACGSNAGEGGPQESTGQVESANQCVTCPRCGGAGQVPCDNPSSPCAPNMLVSGGLCVSCSDVSAPIHFGNFDGLPGTELPVAWKTTPALPVALYLMNNNGYPRHIINTGLSGQVGSGSLTFEDLQPGTYWVQAVPYSDTSPYGSTTPLACQTGDKTGEVTLPLPQSVSYHFHACDGDVNSVSLGVTLYDNYDTASGTFNLSENGNWSFSSDSKVTIYSHGGGCFGLTCNVPGLGSRTWSGCADFDYLTNPIVDLRDSGNSVLVAADWQDVSSYGNNLSSLYLNCSLSGNGHTSVPCNDN